MSPLEATVREHFRKQIEPNVGRSRYLTPESAKTLIEQKTQGVLPILRETLTDDSIPTEDDLFRAKMEASHRTVEGLIPKMRNPTTSDPWRREILSDLANGAEENLARRRAMGPYRTEEQLAELTQEAVKQFRALNEKIKAGRPPTDPPAPQ